MSDIVIRNMEMPKKQPIAILIYPNGTICTDNGHRDYEANDEYKAQNLAPHGELVDREQIYKSCTSADWKITEDTEKIAVALQNAPVVLEASE